MTTDDARKIAEGFRERCAHMGESHGESGRLGQCVGIITSLANQLDDVDGLKARIVELEAAKADAERLAAEAAAQAESEDLTAEPVVAAPTPKKAKKVKA